MDIGSVGVVRIPKGRAAPAIPNKVVKFVDSFTSLKMELAVPWQAVM